MIDVYQRRCVIALLLWFSVLSGSSASHHVADESDPTIPQAFEIQGHGRAFYQLGNLEGMFEYVGRFEGPARQFRYQGFTLGGYYRIHDNVKLGAFYRLQLGARHDDDWIEVGSSWLWEDSTRRVEHLALLDITPRFLLPFLPGKNWVVSAKGRYEYNFSHDLHAILVRPGLTYFWLRDREPFLNFTAQYAAYLPLNFGSRLWYKHGSYVSTLFHVTDYLLVDIGVMRQWTYWSESAQFVAAFPGELYENNIYSPWSLDLGVILRFQ